MGSVLNCTERKKRHIENAWMNRKKTRPEFCRVLIFQQVSEVRRLKKVMNALPKSPNKRNKIVQSLSQKFNLWTVLKSKKPGRPENDLSEYEVEWLCQFTDRLTITHSNTWKKDQRYIGKENGKIKFVPICYLLWTIRDLLEIINGCSGILQGRRSSNSFQKLTFRQLY